ncbi:Abi-alpha family protein [Haloglomus litoreum]|uniref:Abi-alpha family protein n=1 Tax=Haloglomus litoreum TaxID=3034026 RepID=UPI0023E796A4|nr:Abi-alpha family protein [Haloglomus sp. DT116]
MTAREPPDDESEHPGIDPGPGNWEPGPGEQPAEPDGEGSREPVDAETGADKTARADAGDNGDDMASSNEQPSDDTGAPSSTASDGDERQGGEEDDRAGSPARDRTDREDRTDRGDERGREGRRVDGGGDGDESDLDPLDVTEEDLDTADVDQEDLDRLAELLDEARSDPDTVESRDLEDMLTVFDDAGIDTRNLEVEDLEERFDESLKVARMLVTAAANTSEYAGLAGLRAGSRMAEAAFTSESPRDLLEETTDIARDELGRLGLPFGSAGRTPAGTDRSDPGNRRGKDDDTGPITVADLRRRGDRLLELSADVDHEEPFHPAYVRIIEQLSADEARILRLLATEGPQPALDVYDRGLLPIGEGTLVADGLTMLDTDAGLRYEDRSDIYIDNLERLGLLELGTDPLRNLEQYRVLQAQPNVERAEESARRPSTKRRSVRLTPMGIDFCRTVFPFELDERYEGVGNGSE